MSDLIPGKRYQIRITDCCVDALLYGTYIGPCMHNYADGSQFQLGENFDIGWIEGGTYEEWTTSKS